MSDNYGTGMGMGHPAVDLDWEQGKTAVGTGQD